jgi:hypothetical protein
VLVGGVALPTASPLPFGRGAAPAPQPAAVGSVSGIELGVTTPALADNSTTTWAPADLREVNAFEEAVGAHASIVMWYADWKHARVDLGQLRAVSAHGSTPEITWEPWDYTGGLRRAQPRYSLASIAAGRHDAYILAWARVLREYGKPVLLRFAQEMNGDWYPWGTGIGGNRPAQFVAAWRHVHDLFVHEGASNVRWLWTPVARYGLALDTSDYPGDAYVDIVGLSGFNGGTALHWTGWRSFASVFDQSLATLHQLAPSKPVQISEVSSAEAGGSKAAWIAAMFRDLAGHPEVRQLIWFEVAKQTDWRVSSSKQAAAAFATGLRTLGR